MADPELVKILQQGSEVWNHWRNQHPETQHVDLSHADLRRANLSRADLSRADLSGAYLSGADLSSAELSGASLSFARLIHAGLSNAMLNNANLSNADLCRADLAGAELSGAYLSDANLAGAELSGARLSFARLNRAGLSGARLRGADLSNAHLIVVNLSNANLSGADLRIADLIDANLSGADLRHAKLNNTHLSRAILTRSNWTNTIVGSTIFGNLDLRGVIGLETVQHYGPSSIGLDTIYRSHGQIPEAFLRGAGLPETFITNMHALVASMSSIEFYSCFIAYSHSNEDFAKRIHADLQAQGVRCWFADEDLKIGDHYHQRIDEAIRIHDKLIIVLSDASVCSAWVEREVVAAREKEDHQGREVLFPLRLDDAVMETGHAWAADVRRRWHIGDFTDWKNHDHYQQAFERLLRDLKKADE